MSKPTEAELEAIRQRIRAIDHGSFGSCEAFAKALAAAVSSEEIARLLIYDPLCGNLACIIRQVAHREIAHDPKALLATLTRAALENDDIRVEIIGPEERPVSRRTKKNDPPRA